MKPMTREQAEGWVEVLKQMAEHRPGIAVKYPVSPIRKVSCRYVPNMSYGRYQDPVAGDEEFQWTWQTWSEADAERDRHTHIAPEHQGWRGIAHEGEAIDVLCGLAPNLDAGLTLARHFS